MNKLNFVISIQSERSPKKNTEFTIFGVLPHLTYIYKKEVPSFTFECLLKMALVKMTGGIIFANQRYYSLMNLVQSFYVFPNGNRNYLRENFTENKECFRAI